MSCCNLLHLPGIYTPTFESSSVWIGSYIFMKKGLAMWLFSKRGKFRTLFTITEYLKIIKYEDKTSHVNSCYLTGRGLSVPCWSHAGLCFLIAQESDEASKTSRSLAVSIQSLVTAAPQGLTAPWKVTQETCGSCESHANPFLTPLGCKNREGGDWCSLISLLFSNLAKNCILQK